MYTELGKKDYVAENGGDSCENIIGKIRYSQIKGLSI